MKNVLLLAVLLVSVGTTALLSQPPRELPRGPYRSPLLPRLEFLRIVGAGQRSLVADYFWLQAIQAMGRAGVSRNPEDYLDLFYYGDLVTDLDPDFKKAYVFTGVAVPTNLGRETWVNTAEGRKILEKGVARFPNDVNLRLFLAYNLSYFHKQHTLAASHLQHAARLPDAPPHVAEQATRMLGHIGDFDAAQSLVESIYANEEDPEMREFYETRRLEIQRERVLLRVDAAIRAFEQREGRRPESISQLVTAGDLAAAPSDPMGGVIFIGPDGRGASSSTQLRLEPDDFRKDFPNLSKQKAFNPLNP